MISHAHYCALDAQFTCGTILPKTKRKVSPCRIAAEKSVRTIRADDMNKLKQSSEAAIQSAVALIKKIKGKGQLTANEIAEFVGVSRSSAVSKVDRLVDIGMVTKTFLGPKAAVYEWAEGETGVRIANAVLNTTESRMSWMAGQGWLKFRDISDRAGIAMSTAREYMSDLAKIGRIKKKVAGIHTLCIWVEK